MNLREAAQQALEALEVWRDSLSDEIAIPGWRFSVVGERAIADLLDALYEDAMQRFTDVQQEMEAALADQATYGMSITLGGKRIDPAAIYEEQKPIGWLYPEGLAALKAGKCWTAYGTKQVQDRECDIPLCTAPPKREPLTDEEISKIFIYCGRDKETFARAIERAIWEKNGG